MQHLKQTHAHARMLDMHFEASLSNSPLIRCLMLCLRSIGARAVVFGGWPRDLIVSAMLECSIAPADLDVVVDGIDRDHLGCLLPANTVTNAFGGFTTTLGIQKVDIWCIQDTYTLAARRMPFDCALLPSTTVFSVESVIFKPSLFWPSAEVVSDAFYESIECRRIRMQKGEIRFPAFQVGRVLQQAIKLGFDLDIDVVDFIHTVLSAPSGLQQIVGGITTYGHQHLKQPAIDLLSSLDR